MLTSKQSIITVSGKSSLEAAVKTLHQEIAVYENARIVTLSAIGREVMVTAGATYSNYDLVATVEHDGVILPPGIRVPS